MQDDICLLLKCTLEVPFLKAYLKESTGQPAIAVVSKRHGCNPQQVLLGAGLGPVPHLHCCCGWWQSVNQPQEACAARQLQSLHTAAWVTADLGGTAACHAHSTADAIAGHA